MSAIEANFAGQCGECGVRYPPKTMIRMVPEVGWAHDRCPPSPLALPPQPGEVACPDCFLIHPIGACDR